MVNLKAGATVEQARAAAGRRGIAGRLKAVEVAAKTVAVAARCLDQEAGIRVWRPPAVVEVAKTVRDEVPVGTVAVEVAGEGRQEGRRGTTATRWKLSTKWLRYRIAHRSIRRGLKLSMCRSGSRLNCWSRCGCAMSRKRLTWLPAKGVLRQGIRHERRDEART